MADELRMIPRKLLRKTELEPDADFLRDGVRALAQALMELDISRHLSADPGVPGTHQGRPMATRAASLDEQDAPDRSRHSLDWHPAWRLRRLGAEPAPTASQVGGEALETASAADLTRLISRLESECLLLGQEREALRSLLDQARATLRLSELALPTTQKGGGGSTVTNSRASARPALERLRLALGL